MEKRQKYSSGAKWEKVVGYSRAVKVGTRIYVTGTTATGENSEIVGVGDAYAQTVQTIKNIEHALIALGAVWKTSSERECSLPIFRAGKNTAERTVSFSIKLCPRRRWLKFQN